MKWAKEKWVSRDRRTRHSSKRDNIFEIPEAAFQALWTPLPWEKYIKSLWLPKNIGREKFWEKAKSSYWKNATALTATKLQHLEGKGDPSEYHSHKASQNVWFLLESVSSIWWYLSRGKFDRKVEQTLSANGRGQAMFPITKGQGFSLLSRAAFLHEQNKQNYVKYAHVLHLHNS